MQIIAVGQHSHSRKVHAHELFYKGLKERVRCEMKVTQCIGEGLGSCKRCSDKGIWNGSWMCFLYSIEGYEGCYCSDCVKEIKEEHERCKKSSRA